MKGQNQAFSLDTSAQRKRKICNVLHTSYSIVKLYAEKKTSAQPKRFDLTEGKLVEPGYRGKYVITSGFLVYNIVSNFTCTIDGKKKNCLL